MPDSEPKGIRVTVEDLETGDTDTAVIWDDYFLLCAGCCHLTYTNLFPSSGTVQLTIKGVKR